MSVRVCAALTFACLVLAGCAAAIGPAGTAGQNAATSAPDHVADAAGTVAPGSASTARNSQSASTVDRLRPQARIAMLLPLSGNAETAAVAKGMRQAGEMALFQIDNPGFQLIVKDTAGTPEGASRAAAEAISEGAELIVGPLFASSVTAVTPAARQAGVPILAFSNDRRVAGDGVYLLSFLVGAEVDRVVGFAIARGKRRFAALMPDDTYGTLAGDAFRAAVQRGGGTIVASERYAGSANGMLEPAQRLLEAVRGAEEQGAPVDAIFLPGGQETLPRLGPMLKHGRLDTTRVKLLGTGGWDYPGLGRDPMFVGAWYPTPDPRGWRAFSEQFGRTFGSAPPRIASLAHDAVSIAAVLAAGAEKGQRYLPAQMTQPRGFTGVDGPVRLAADGTALRSLAIVEVQPFGATVIDAAPATPGPATPGQGDLAPAPAASADPAPSPTIAPAFSRAPAMTPSTASTTGALGVPRRAPLVQ